MHDSSHCLTFRVQVKTEKHRITGDDLSRLGLLAEVTLNSAAAEIFSQTQLSPRFHVERIT